jgi:putative ABC transport system permease protein
MKVTGVLEETGSQDDSLIFMKLETAQSILGKKGRLSMIEVAALCNACPVSEMVEQISGQLPDAKVTALQQVVAGRLNTLAEIKRLSLALSGIIMGIGTLVVFVTMMSNVRERRSEIGILRAIGYRRSHVVSIILMETGILSVFGGIAGYASGFAAARILALLSAGAEPLMIHSEPAGLVFAVLLALAAGLAAGIYPALTASSLDPAEALRSI